MGKPKHKEAKYLDQGPSVSPMEEIQVQAAWAPESMGLTDVRGVMWCAGVTQSQALKALQMKNRNVHIETSTARCHRISSKMEIYSPWGDLCPVLHLLKIKCYGLYCSQLCGQM